MAALNVVVIGAGVFGAWTAHHLLAAGARVTLVDAYGPANSRASSGDESRIIRCGYGPDEIYSRWARESLAAWVDLFGPYGAGAAPLIHRCGVLWLAGDDAYTGATYDTLRRLDHPVERLDAAALAARFPHVSAPDATLALLEPDCGVLMARRAVQTLVAGLERRGVRVLRARVAGTRGAHRLAALRTDDGRELHGDRFVFACGPWLPGLFPEVLDGRIRPTRQVVVYFGVPPGDDRFGPSQTPAWVDFAAGIYGVPDLEGRGVKVGIDRHGPPFDPDRGERVADAGSIDTARAWLARRMPALASAPVVESRVCQYENTATGDFLIDRHPEVENVWFAGGGSGHGFKHGPAVGRYTAALVQGTGRVEPRFTLATKGVTPQRSVF
jgi:glycine/D-amino acid oxidase-like deaminating enzyme